ncbi:YggT family protein [Candidatus Peregrinibacteria bacterium]|nr:MAG: YggT family protein [Candidatus Peregrinibacteria bacterium]
MDFLKQTLNILIDLLIVLVFLRVIFSWFRTEGALVQLLNQCTEPFLAPLRRVLPQMGMLDFSPLILLLLMQIIRSLINAYL